MHGMNGKRDTSVEAKRLQGTRSVSHQIFFMACGFLCFFWGATAPAAHPDQGQSSNSITDTDAVTKVVMLEIPSVTPNADELYTAILAQLAASGYQLHRLPIATSAFDADNAVKSAAAIAVSHNVEMVFWIQLNPDSCLLSIYFKEGEEKLVQRKMKLESQDLSSQYEVISNGVSSLVEETVFTVREKKRAPEPPVSVSPAARAVSADRRTAGMLEISLLYNGMLFSKQHVSNGVHVGLGVFTGEKFMLNLAFTQNAPMGFENDQYRFSLSTRNLDAGLFANLRVRASQLRFGISYGVQLRTFTMESRLGGLEARRSKLHGIHGVEPSIQLAWPLAGRFLIDMGVGTMVCVNEHGYVVSRSDGTRYNVANPYDVKLTFHLGIIFQSK